MKWNLVMKGEMDKSIHWLRFQSSLLKMDRSTIKKTCKNTGDLNNTIKQMDLIENARTFHPTITNNNFFQGYKIHSSR